MSNCFSLTSAEPFFNLLTGSEREGGRENREEEEEERKEEKMVVAVNIFLLCWFQSKVGGKDNSARDFGFGPLFFLGLHSPLLSASQELLGVREVPGEQETGGG